MYSVRVLGREHYEWNSKVVYDYGDRLWASRNAARSAYGDNGIVTLTGSISGGLVLSASDEQSFLSSSPLPH
jgi:hypothetical protein